MSFNNSEDVRQYINTNIKTNGRRLISGAAMNTALNGLLQLAESRQGSGLIVQNYPTPEAFKQRIPGSIWLQPLKTTLHVIDTTGTWVYMQLPFSGIVNESSTPGSPGYSRPIEVFDLGIQGVKESMWALGIPPNSITWLMNMLKESACSRLLERTKENTHIIYDKPGERRALLDVLRKTVAGAAVYFDASAGLKEYFNVSQACLSFQGEYVHLFSEGGVLFTAAGKRLFAGMLLLIANGTEDFRNHPNTMMSSLPLLQEPGNRAEAVSCLGSYFDRIASALA